MLLFTTLNIFIESEERFCIIMSGVTIIIHAALMVSHNLANKTQHTLWYHSFWPQKKRNNIRKNSISKFVHLSIFIHIFHKYLWQDCKLHWQIYRKRVSMFCQLCPTMCACLAFFSVLSCTHPSVVRDGCAFTTSVWTAALSYLSSTRAVRLTHWSTSLPNQVKHDVWFLSQNCLNFLNLEPFFLAQY